MKPNSFWELGSRVPPLFPALVWRPKNEKSDEKRNTQSTENEKNKETSEPIEIPVIRKEKILKSPTKFINEENKNQEKTKSTNQHNINQTNNPKTTYD